MTDTERAEKLLSDLENHFYDNIKVKWSERLGKNYINWAIAEGFSNKEIVQNFASALEQRHADATDMGLNQGNPRMKFEMTSTASLAKEKLLKLKETSGLMNENKKQIKVMTAENIDENNKVRRNQEINDRLEGYMDNNKDLVNYYNGLDKEELVRKACLSRMFREERAEKKRAYIESKNEEATQFLDENPEMKAKIEEESKKFVNNVMLKKARQQMQSTGNKIAM